MTETITYAVPGISCEHCRSAIEREIAPLPGVTAVDVDLDARQVTVTGKELDERAIVQALDAAGYDVA